MARSLLLLVLLVAWPASAHDWYSYLIAPQGGSCCGGDDCRPVESAVRDGEIHVLVEGLWWRAMDPRWFHKSPSPDDRWHACQPEDRPTPVCTIGPLNGV